jgi:hypothetical protein
MRDDDDGWILAVTTQGSRAAVNNATPPRQSSQADEERIQEINDQIYYTYWAEENNYLLSTIRDDPRRIQQVSRSAASDVTCNVFQ